MGLCFPGDVSTKEDVLEELEDLGGASQRSKDERSEDRDASGSDQDETLVIFLV